MANWDVIQTTPLSGYAPEGALGVNVSVPQIYVSGSALMWEPVGGSGANFPVNTDITAMEGIPNTVINSSGYQLGTIGAGTGLVITNGNILSGIVDAAHKGWELGYDLGSGGGGTLVLSAVGGGTTLSGTNGLSTSSIVSTVNAQLTNVTIAGALTCATSINNQTPGTPITIEGTDGISAGNPNLILSGLINYANATTQSTVGAAGGASALPATPSLYELREVNGTKYVSPLYAVS